MQSVCFDAKDIVLHLGRFALLTYLTCKFAFISGKYVKSVNKARVALTTLQMES